MTIKATLMISGYRVPDWAYIVTQTGIEFSWIGRIVFKLMYLLLPKGAVHLDFKT